MHVHSCTILKCLDVHGGCAIVIQDIVKRVNPKPSMVGVSFIPFPKPKTNLERCKAWIKACGRKNFTIDNITRKTYVCSKHFHNGQPSELYPDPYPAQSSQMLQEMRPK